MDPAKNETIDENWSNEEWMIPYLFFLLIIGTIGNTFGLILFLTASMRKFSCSLYFLFMVIFDEISLFFWITNRLSGDITNTELRNRSTILCKLFVVIYYSSSQASIGMLVLAMFDRLYTSFKIAHGYFDVRLFIRRRHFQYTCISIFFFIIISINALLFGSQLVQDPDDNVEYCLIINPYISHVYSIIDLCVYAIVPCICMLVGDILILYYIQQTRARVIPTNNVNKQREKQLSIMLVITSIVSLFIVSPYSLFNILINFSNILKDDYRTLATLHDVFGLLSTFTHAMHFYLFLIISSAIRRHFKSLLRSFIKGCSNRRNVIQPIVIPSIKRVTSTQPTVNIIQRSPYLQTT